MRNEIQALIFDIDGVITDGRKYIDGISQEFKSVAYKDMDSITAFRKEGVLVGCISGEDTSFSKAIAKLLDFSFLGEKNKQEVLKKFCNDRRIDRKNICYIGDGKYDLEALQYAGYSACPCDALQEVKNVSNILLNTPGGCGCIAELYTVFHKRNLLPANDSACKQCSVHKCNYDEAISKLIRTRFLEHIMMVELFMTDMSLLDITCIICRVIIDAFKRKGRLFLCGNGGSAADAQHLAAEMVGRFKLERRALPAESLSTDTSVITSLANDYDYEMVFARQIEAKGRPGDVLVGITTSGRSGNILKAFEYAKKKEMSTVLMTGRAGSVLPILNYTDHVIHIPSSDTARIQEGHILVGHIICEIIEAGLAEGE